MKYILHIDTSTDTGIIAISGNGEVLSYLYTEETRNHAGVINNMITEVANKINISLEQISAVTVCAGPGSYTGLRIGLATAKGLCYALDKPLMLDNKLALLAYRARQQHPSQAQYISLLVAREKEYFVSVYSEDMTSIIEPQHVTEDQLKGLIRKDVQTYIIADAPENVIENLHISDLKIDRDTKTDLISWSFYSFEKYNCNHFVNLMEAEPFYLKQVYTHK